jgi:glycosyltransferase involved in cell wall biosynthesis
VGLGGKLARDAQEAFRKLYEDSGLVAPRVRWVDWGLDLRSVSCDAPDLVGSGMPRPLVSVILTAHNEEKHLPIAVHSLLQQDWRNIELLVVDDGSTDATVQVATELAAQDSRIRVLRMRENGGTWKAKNLALEHARGEFITMHDADDWSHPSKLSLQIAPLLRDASLMCTSSYFFRVDEQTGLPYTRNAASFLRWNASSLLYRREVVRDIGNYRDLLGADCEFAERIELRWGVRSHLKVRKPLAIGLQRPASLSSKYRLQQDSIRLRQWEQWRREHVQQYAAHAQARRAGGTQ